MIQLYIHSSVNAQELYRFLIDFKSKVLKLYLNEWRRKSLKHKQRTGGAKKKKSPGGKEYATLLNESQLF